MLFTSNLSIPRKTVPLKFKNIKGDAWYVEDDKDITRTFSIPHTKGWYFEKPLINACERVVFNKISEQNEVSHKNFSRMLPTF